MQSIDARVNNIISLHSLPFEVVQILCERCRPNRVFHIHNRSLSPSIFECFVSAKASTKYSEQFYTDYSSKHVTTVSTVQFRRHVSLRRDLRVSFRGERQFRFDRRGRFAQKLFAQKLRVRLRVPIASTVYVENLRRATKGGLEMVGVRK